MNGRGATQVTLVLGGFLGKNVALEGLTALDGTARTHHEALCSTLLGLHLRHDNSIIRWIWVCGRPDGHYPPFETHSTWYADRQYCQRPLFRNRRTLALTPLRNLPMPRRTPGTASIQTFATRARTTWRAAAPAAYFFFFGAS